MTDETIVDVTLESLAGGALTELFARELGVVLGNIQDINTDPDAVREITLKVKLKPNDSREVVVVRASASSKLASVKGIETAIYVGRRGGQVIATEYNPRQMNFNELNVVDIKKGEANK